MARSDAGDAKQAAKEFQKEEKGGADSSKQFKEAGHQARNDAQDSGEKLPNRDRSKK